MTRRQSDQLSKKNRRNPSRILPSRVSISLMKRSAKKSKNQKPSKRGELEITDLIQKYLDRGQLRVEVLGRGIAWLDAGTQESLLQAANFVQVVEERQGWMISCPEEIAFRMGYIDKEELRKQAEKISANQYGQYLLRLLEDE